MTQTCGVQACNNHGDEDGRTDGVDKKFVNSRTSLLRTPGDFADLYVVSIGRCNHGPLNQIRYTKFTQTNFIKN